MGQFGDVPANTTLLRSVILTIDDFRKGTTAPTDGEVGTTPAIATLRHNATNETTSSHVVMPADWDKSKNCSIDIIWSLRDVEVNNDVLSITIDYVTISKNTTGAGIAKTSTQLLPTVTVTTANGLAIGDIYSMGATLLASDSDNGFGVGDNAIGFCFEFHLTNLVGVVDIDAISGCINYEALY